MNQKQYIDALKKALKGIDSQSRDNILMEIQGLLSETDIKESIETRFGSPEELAKQYLEGEKLRPNVSTKVMSAGKKLLIAIGALVTLIVLGISLFAWYHNQDRFDYADTSVEALNPTGKNWHSVVWNSQTKLEIEQGRTIIYWHDKNELRWNCGGDYKLDPIPNKTIRIRHFQCLIFIPRKASLINLNQADVVLIQPAETALKIKQSKLRIATKGAKYQFSINATRSAIGNFISDKEATSTISIEAEESQIQAYKY